VQHQYRDFIVDRESAAMSIGLSFGGIPSALTIPFMAITGFADPSVQFGLQFTYVAPEAAPVAEPEPPKVEAPAAPPPAADSAPQVVSLDAFRRRRD